MVTVSVTVLSHACEASSALIICVQILSLLHDFLCCVLKACPRPEPDHASWQMWQMELVALALHHASQCVHRVDFLLPVQWGWVLFSV